MSSGSASALEMIVTGLAWVAGAAVVGGALPHLLPKLGRYQHIVRGALGPLTIASYLLSIGLWFSKNPRVSHMGFLCFIATWCASSAFRYNARILERASTPPPSPTRFTWSKTQLLP